MLRIEKLVFSDFRVNTYIIWDENTKIAAVVDPACYDKMEEGIFISFIEKKGLELKYMISTHCHIDHIFGNAFIKKKYNIIYLAPEKDEFLLELMIKQAASYGMILVQSPKPDEYLSSENPLQIGDGEIEFLFTPGHTPGEFCIYLRNEKKCITGDVLFKSGIGRTDLWGGDYFTLIESIEEKLLTLPDDTIIYPGHGDESTIGEEKTTNTML